jgi:hypothetical protein
MQEFIKVGEQDSELRVASPEEGVCANLMEGVVQDRQRKSDWSSIALYFKYPGV